MRVLTCQPCYTSCYALLFNLVRREPNSVPATAGTRTYVHAQPCRSEFIFLCFRRQTIIILRALRLELKRVDLILSYHIPDIYCLYFHTIRYNTRFQPEVQQPTGCNSFIPHKKRDTIRVQQAQRAQKIAKFVSICTHVRIVPTCGTD